MRPNSRKRYWVGEKNRFLQSINPWVTHHVTWPKLWWDQQSTRRWNGFPLMQILWIDGPRNIHCTRMTENLSYRRLEVKLTYLWGFFFSPEQLNASRGPITHTRSSIQCLKIITVLASVILIKLCSHLQLRYLIMAELIYLVQRKTNLTYTGQWLFIFKRRSRHQQTCWYTNFHSYIRLHTFF